MFWPIILLIFPLSTYCAEEIEQIEVTTETKELAPFFYGTSSTLETEDLKTAPVPLLPSALERVPGVVGVQNGGPGGRTSFFLRGTESRHVSVTLDELKLNDPSNTDRQFDAAFLSLTFLRDVTVHQGPQAVLFGSDALGGLVELRTKKGEEAPRKHVTFTGGSHGTLGISPVLDWKSREHRGTLSALHLRSDGISRLNKKRFGARERDATRTTQLTSSSNHKLGTRIASDLLVSFSRGHSELDGNTVDNSHDESLSDQLLLQQKTVTPLSSGKLALRTGLNRHQRSIDSMVSGSSSFSGSVLQNELTFKQSEGSHDWVAGAAYEKERASFEGFDPDSNLGSLFSQLALKNGPWTWQGGLRAERHSRYGHFLTGSSGIKWQDFSFQVTRGYKAPSLYQLFAPPLFGTTIGNEDLSPETSTSAELKWEKKSEAIDAGVTLFQNRLKDLITFTNAGFRNQGGFRAEGVEPLLRLRSSDLQLVLSGVHQEFKRREGPVLRRPLTMARAQLSWFPEEATEVFTQLKWFGARKDFDPNLSVVKLNAYETVELGARQTRGRHEFSLQFLNLFDREYEELYGFSVLPRSVFGSYGVSF